MTGDRITAVQQGLRHLMTALANVNLYAEEHQQVALLCAQAREQFAKGMAGEAELSIYLVDSQLICNGIPLETTLYSERFGAVLSKRKISHVRIVNGVTELELRVFAAGLSARGGGREIVSTSHLRVGTVSVEFGAAGTAAAEEMEIAHLEPPDDLQKEDDRELVFYREIIRESSQPGKIPMTAVTGLVAELIDRLRDDQDAALAQVFSATREEHQLSHATKVAILNLAQGMLLGIEGEALRDLGIAGLLHDIGKIFIPSDLLEKERMDAAEWDIYCRHPVKGALYLLDLPWVPRLAVITALDHHFRSDGSGYPSLGPVWQQNLCSRITAVSDLYDALVFTTAVPHTRIGYCMAGMAATTIHPGLTRQFLELMAKHTARGQK